MYLCIYVYIWNIQNIVLTRRAESDTLGTSKDKEVWTAKKVVQASFFRKALIVSSTKGFVNKKIRKKGC